jgi:integrase
MIPLGEDGRVVFLSPELKTLIAAQIQRVRLLSRKLGRVLPGLFHHLHGCYKGQPVYDFRKAWSHACERVGLVGMLRHDFRRSAVRNMERAGVPRSVAMKISGHKTESIYRRYAIVSESDIQDATRRLLSRAQFGHTRLNLRFQSTHK